MIQAWFTALIGSGHQISPLLWRVIQVTGSDKTQLTPLICSRRRNRGMVTIRGTSLVQITAFLAIPEDSPEAAGWVLFQSTNEQISRSTWKINSGSRLPEPRKDNHHGHDRLDAFSTRSIHPS
jgi:hypothetical protein